MTHPQDTTPANPAQVTDAMVKDATTEFLSHKGERPWRVTRRGAELWEDYAPAMRAALTVAIGAGGQAVAWQYTAIIDDDGIERRERRIATNPDFVADLDPVAREIVPLYTHPVPSGQAVAVWRLPDVEAVLSEMLSVATGEHDDGDDDWLSSQRAAVDVWQAAIRSAIAHPVQPGWRLVPEEPTEAMLKQGSLNASNGQQYVGEYRTGQAWKAMISAAPPPKGE